MNPIDFAGWLATEPQEFLLRITNGEKGNPANPILAAELAFEAGIKAGYVLATQRLIETIWGQKWEFIGCASANYCGGNHE